MSKNSARQSIEACQEWIQWGKTKYVSLRKKRKANPQDWMKGFDYDGK